MFKVEIIQKVNIPTISEDTLKILLSKAITDELPEGVVINDLEFKVTRKGGQEVTLEVDAQFAETTAISKAAAKLASAEPIVEKKAPVELPEADDVPEPVEDVISRDGVFTPEKTELDLIDEVLAEEEEALAQEEKAVEPAPSTAGKSLAELFNS